MQQLYFISLFNVHVVIYDLTKQFLSFEFIKQLLQK